MFSLKQAQWFSFRIFNVNGCLLKSQLYNLKNVFLNGKLSLYNYCFISVMRIKSSKVRKRSLNKIKLHIMATISNSKNNKTILKAESSTKVQTMQCSSSSPANCVSGTRSKEEDTKTRHKESIKSFNDSSKNKSKQTLSSTVNKIHKSRENTFSNILMPSLNGNVNWRYHNSMWSTSINESCVIQNVSVRHPIVYRSFSDSGLQRHINLAYLNNTGTTTNHYNRYHMRRSNTLDSTNITAGECIRKVLVIFLWGL